MSPGLPRPAPLVSRRQVQPSILGMAVGLALGVWGWAGARGQDSFSDQLVFVNLACMGAAVAATAQAGLLLHARRAVGRRRVALLAAPAPRVVAGTTADPVGDLVHLAHGRWYHRAGCTLVAGKPGAGGRRPQSLAPCPVCEP